MLASSGCLARDVYPGDATTPGPSTPQITALAVICSGRDDRIEGNLDIPTEAKIGVSGARVHVARGYGEGTGNSTVMRVPLPGVLSAVIDPP